MKRATKLRDVVLLGTDFSQAAGEAADVAASLAARLERPLVLTHVASPAAGTAMQRRDLRARLAAEAARLRDGGVAVVEELHDGHPDEVLAARARRLGARLLVLGSTGVRGRRGQIGSVSERTAESAPVPTLVVRAARPLVEWARGRRPLRVFLAFDFTVTAEAALVWVAEWRRLGPCEMTVGYVNWPESRQAMGYPADPSAESNPAPVQAALERDLQSRVRSLLGDTSRLVIRAARGRADLALIELAAASGADLMVAGSHQQHGLGRLVSPSVSRGLLHHASASVAVVPAVQALRRLPPVPELRRVLVATDLSPLANRAVAHALAIAAPGGTVRLVHVVHPRAVSGGRFESGLRSSGRHNQHLDACRRRLQALVPADGAARGLTVEAHVVEARDEATGIVQEAERFAADAVVLGSQGRSALGRVLLGSVAQAVLSATTRPVFVVRFPRE